jgi:thiamine biosynthesis lipoprotein
MKQTKIIMGMPITVEISDSTASEKNLDDIFSYFKYVDEKFSPFKITSELTKINDGIITENNYSEDMKEVFQLSQKTKEETGGYFNIINADGKYNPSGLVKGWSIYKAAKILEKEGFQTFYVDAGGDIEARGKYWKVGIRNPFKREDVIKVLYIKDKGIATSGTYIRGEHIYIPPKKYKPATEIVSITVIGPNVYEADRFATATFAMGKNGINFIEKLSGFEGYAIDKNGIATMTSGLEKYTLMPDKTYD